MTDLDRLHDLKLAGGDREAVGEERRWPLLVAAGVIVLGLVGGAVYYWLGARTGIAVQTATAAVLSDHPGASSVLQATGYVTARRRATVSAQITGTVADVLIEEGDEVRAGQVLAHLNSTAQHAQLEQAEAQLNASRATLAQLRAQLRQAQRDLIRTQDLTERKLLSQQALEVAQTQVEALVAQADSQLRMTELADAGVRAARVQLDYATVRAPFAGVVTAKSAQVGEIVSPLSAGGGFTRTGIGTIVDMTSLEIEVDVNEAYIHRVSPMQRAVGILDAYPTWEMPVHVVAIIPTADRGKATVKVRLALDVRDKRILPEMGVRVNFLEPQTPASATAPAAVAVPVTAIVDKDGRSSVYQVVEGRAHVVAVTPGATFGELRVVDGIAADAVVVTQPPANLADGSRVESGARAK